jgi:hypothetical protein
MGCGSDTISPVVGVWRSLVARLHGVQKVVGSNPATPTIKSIGYRNIRASGFQYFSENSGKVIFVRCLAKVLCRRAKVASGIFSRSPFGGLTAERLIKDGKAEAVKRYLDQIAEGGYA